MLFGDLVGFTNLSESRDQEDVHDVQSRYFDECRHIVGRYGGTIEKFIGDAVMAVWGVPTAHEDDAERAVRAGLELVSAVAALRESVAVPDLDMRVGIVTGEVAVTIGATQQGMVTGDTVNTASRVQSVAAPGQVWVDETTRLLTSSAITFADTGSHTLKGKADPVPLWSVRAVVAAVGGAMRADGLEAPLVGRARELRLAKELFHRVEESRRQALLVIAGEPGTGKTRLAWEFEKYVDGLSTSTMWHSGRCVSYGEGVAYYALAEAIRGRLEAVRLTDEQELADLLEQALGTYVSDADERDWLRPRLEVLLGAASGEGYSREDLFAAWTSFLRGVSGDERPVVLVIDDAQYADEGLVAFAEHLTSSASFPCFVLLLSRPELLAKNVTLASSRRVTVLHLEELGADDMGHVLDGLVSGLPPAVRDALVERAEGVPLYAVEIVRSLIDRDLVLPRGGQYVLADTESLDLGTVTAPTSLQTLIAARLDAMTDEQRAVVCQASVLGTSFTREALATLCPGVDLDSVLASLVKQQVVRREDDRLSAERGQFIFVHSVVRQVAYGTLSRRDRRAAHLAVALQFEAGVAGEGDLAPVIAQHYLEAVRAAPDDETNPALVEAAVARLRQAADRARLLGAPAEAAAHLRVAFGLVEETRPRAEIERDLARVEVVAGQHESAVTHGRSAMAVFDELGDEINAAVAAAQVARALQVGELDNVGALELARPRYQSLLGRSDAEQVLLALAHPITSALSRVPVGDHRAPFELDEALQQQAALAERVGDRTATSRAWNSLAARYQELGAPDLARELLQAAADMSRRAHDPLGLSLALVNLNADYNREDALRAAEFGRDAVTATRTSGDRTDRVLAVSNLLIALCCRAEWDQIDAVLTDNQEALHDLVDPTIEYVRMLAARARGLSHELPWEPRPTGDVDDPQSLLWARATESLVLLDRGRGEAALAAALEAVEAADRFSGITDDFFIVWLTAMHVATTLGRTDTLTELLGMVDTVPDPQLSQSLRAGRAHVGALLAIPRGESAETVERAFRKAIEEYEAWGAGLFTARCRTDHAAWHRSCGRVVESDAEATEVREFYAETGSSRWLTDLEERLAATPV